jgi:hypothetical protein
VSALKGAKFSYETTPKWHGFFQIKLAALAAASRAKQRTAACDEPFGRELKIKRLRVERLSRIEYRITNIEFRSVESLRSIFL